MESLLEGEDTVSSFVETNITFPLYRQPYRIGDTFDLDQSDDRVMVVAIQDVCFRSWRQGIQVLYFVQRLRDNNNYPSYERMLSNPYGLIDLRRRISLSEQWDVSIHRPGHVIMVDGCLYQFFQIKDLIMEGMDLFIHYYCCPVYPFSRQTIRSTLKHERRRDLGFHVV